MTLYYKNEMADKKFMVKSGGVVWQAGNSRGGGDATSEAEYDI